MFNDAQRCFKQTNMLTFQKIFSLTAFRKRRLQGEGRFSDNAMAELELRVRDFNEKF